MGLDHASLSDAELTGLARVCRRDPADLAAELHRRPWAIHDILAAPAVVEEVLDPDDLIEAVSPFVLFAVVARRAADDLVDQAYVNDWVGPRERLPVFDVEPLREFATAPGRLIFVARLLASMVVPTCAVVPVATTDPWELIAWLDAVEEVDRVTVLRRLGDTALFLAGVHADAVGDAALSANQVERIAVSLGLTPEAVVEQFELDAAVSGPEVLERVGAGWYRESRRLEPTTPPVVGDIAQRIGSARRFLTHLSDNYFPSGDLTVGIA